MFKLILNFWENIINNKPKNSQKINIPLNCNTNIATKDLEILLQLNQLSQRKKNISELIFSSTNNHNNPFAFQQHQKNIHGKNSNLENLTEERLQLKM